MCPEPQSVHTFSIEQIDRESEREAKVFSSTITNHSLGLSFGHKMTVYFDWNSNLIVAKTPAHVQHRNDISEHKNQFISGYTITEHTKWVYYYLFVRILGVTKCEGLVFGLDRAFCTDINEIYK